MIKLINGDCLKVIENLGTNSIDLVLTDLPYGITREEWDTPICLKTMWEKLDKITHEKTAYVFTACTPFSADLLNSNRQNFRYSLVWQKTTPTGHLNCRKMPLRSHEDILIFYKKLPTYNPQKTKGHKRKVSNKNFRAEGIYGKQTKTTSYDSTERYPTSVITTSTDKQKEKLHPTQKPVELMEYLIKSYSNQGANVLDLTMGSGSTGVAAIKNERNFYGIELNEKYFRLAEERIYNYYLDNIM